MTSKYAGYFLGVTVSPLVKFMDYTGNLIAKTHRFLTSKPLITIRTFHKTYHKELLGVYPDYEVDAVLRLVCEDLLGWSQTDFLLKNDDELTAREVNLLDKALQELKNSKPVQYVTGKAHFYGHEFAVNEHTLIPRQETEELVDLIIKEHKNALAPRILDIGTGSGCIAVSLALELPQSQVTAIDFCEDALKVARHNACSLQTTVKFRQQDILNTPAIEAYDIVVSNPPYVRTSEKAAMHANVLQHEPHTALFVENDNPLVFYEKILKLNKPSLHTLIYFEINQYLGRELVALASDLGFTSTLINDLNSNNRILKCWQS